MVKIRWCSSLEHVSLYLCCTGNIHRRERDTRCIGCSYRDVEVDATERRGLNTESEKCAEDIVVLADHLTFFD